MRGHHEQHQSAVFACFRGSDFCGFAAAFFGEPVHALLRMVDDDLDVSPFGWSITARTEARRGGRALSRDIIVDVDRVFMLAFVWT